MKRSPGCVLSDLATFFPTFSNSQKVRVSGRGLAVGVREGFGVGISLSYKTI